MPLSDADFQAFCCLTSILLALFLAVIPAALFLVSGLLLLLLENLQECYHLRRR